MENAKLLIKAGTVVNEDRAFEADILCIDGIVRSIGKEIAEVPPDVTIIDATGRYVIPGGIDPHVHLQLPTRGIVSSDDFFTGTRAALAGGTTMIMDFVFPLKESLVDSFKTWKGWAEERSCCDFSLHVVVKEWNEKVALEMKQLVEQEGVNSFKVFMSYKSIMVTDEDMYNIFKQTRDLKAIAMVHAENGTLIMKNEEELFNKGINGPEAYAMARPEEVESEATLRAITIAKQVDCPLYVVHVTGGEAADIIKTSRMKGDPVYGEGMISAIAVDGQAYWNEDWEFAVSHLSGPRISPHKDTRVKLLDYLACDNLQLMGSDHVTFTIEQRLAAGRDDFRDIPHGVNGVEERMAVLWELGVESGKMDPCRFVAVTSTTAAKIFGLYPQKGVIAVGADADIVVWNSSAVRTISSQTHHMACNFNVFEGMVCHGVPEVVICNGRVVVHHDTIRVVKGSGRYLKNPVSPQFVYARLQAQRKAYKVQ